MSARAITDAAARRRALDPPASCIVQAPAGSGKTGLLIQRYLRLLALVERPEEIVAITFTRKAAAEMRRRVLQALDRAARKAPVGDDNERLTRELADAALARDAAQGWDLRANAARLRIHTIDALSASLARQMPVLAGIGAQPAIVDDASDLYREAAERTLATLENEDAADAPVQHLLRHLDGDWGVARGLLESMLRRRDQWLPRIAGVTADAAVRAVLEDAFRAERARIIEAAVSLLPPHEVQELIPLARYAAGNCPDFDCLSDLVNLPDEGHDHSPLWAALVKLLLKEDGQFRKQVDVRTGFPADAASKPTKTRMMELLQRLGGVDRLCDALQAVRRMPPARFTEAQWQVLGAMVHLLPAAAAQLQVVFGERGQIDFTGVARAAVQALGDPESPTDLLLALDVRVRHLLIDEFQDTSLGQWQLLERLTAGWTAGDGRTVFLVGDPMQSIYRFREADVTVFLRAREQGLPGVALENLRLATNFRSQAGIVEWVNGAFRDILPREEDRDAGAVPYSDSEAFHARADGDAVQWHPFVGTDPERARLLEAARVVDIARRALAEPDAGSVAILVRNRSHLDRIVPALKRAEIPYRAIEIEPLGRRPVVQDLLAITRALAHPADRIAWLAILRAPWCALGVADLLALTGGIVSSREGARATVWELLHDASRLAALSEEGRERAVRAREALRPFVEGRLRGSLRQRVEAAWLGLAGPAAVERASDLDDAETFFDQLDALSDAGDIADAAVLEQKLAKLHASAEGEVRGCVQLLTIHKAKGLEFGTVILPGLDRYPRISDRGLFAWKARADGRLMMAPIRATGEESEAGYDYLRRLDGVAEEHELERVLYVAATRAVRRLHLLGYVRQGENGLRKPPERTLLGKAWPVAEAAFLAATPMPERADAAGTAAQWDDLRAIDAALFEVDVPPVDARVVPRAIDEPPRIEFSWVGETSREVGTITHRWLQRIGQEGIDAWPATRIAALAPSIRAHLARRGVPPAERDEATSRVTRALRETLDDPRGRWLLDAHPESRFEYRLRVATAERVRLIAIDRLFTTAGGERWIVDYKTSPHEGGDVEAFLDREMDRYREQLAGYAAAIGGPVKLGLYFPLLRGWREWSAGEVTAPDPATA